MEINTSDSNLNNVLIALSNITRIKILDLCIEEMTIKSLAKVLNLSEASTSIHVHKLVDAGLLEVIRNGRRTKVYKRKYRQILIRFSYSDINPSE